MAELSINSSEARAILMAAGGLTTYSRRHYESGRLKLIAIRDGQDAGVERRSVANQIIRAEIERIDAAIETYEELKGHDRNSPNYRRAKRWLSALYERRRRLVAEVGSNE